MPRDLGSYAPKRPHKLNGPLLAMLLNGLHDRHGGRVFVLQVGAGPGETGLPLLQRFRDDGWSGLLIEPHPTHFAALETLHADSDRVAVLNLGISDISANLPLHSLTPEAEARLPRLPRGHASLIRDRIAVAGTTDEDITSAEVPFLRMDAVLRELGIDSVQLVAINAAGHEAQALRSFDLAALDPTLTLVGTTPGTAADAECIAALDAAKLLPFRIGDQLVGLKPGSVAVPMDDLLPFLNKGASQTADPE